MEIEQITARLHTTPMGCARIRRNLKLECGDALEWCRDEISRNFKSIEKRGKNYYVNTDKAEFTINASSFTLITAHKI